MAFQKYGVDKLLQHAFVHVLLQIFVPTGQIVFSLRITDQIGLDNIPQAVVSNRAGRFLRKTRRRDPNDHAWAARSRDQILFDSVVAAAAPHI